jgi:DNA-binding IclR family transcriptional regulator
MRVGSVVNAVAILRHLAAGERHGVNVIARMLSISPSTCFNILKTLVNEEFVDFDTRSKTYSLSSEPTRIFGSESPLLAWREWVAEALVAITREFSVTSGLWRVVADRVVLSEVFESPHKTRIHLVRGQRLPVHIGAMGRCFAAAEDLSIEAVEERITKVRWAEPPDAQAFWNDMKLVRARGWAIDEGQYLKGVTTIAAPIVGLGGSVRFCLTATMFTGQHVHETHKVIGERIGALARLAQDRLIGEPNVKAA